MRWLYPFALALTLAACGGGGADIVAVPEPTPIPAPPPQTPPPQTPPPQTPPPEADACAPASQQQTVSGYMGQHYFWYDQLASADTSAPTIAAYFNSLLYKPTDRYSFTESTAAYEQRVNIGVRTGYGYSLVWQDSQQTQLRVRFVEPKGPAGLAGLKRGDTILSMDGFTPQQVAAGQPPAVSTAGVARRVVLRDTQGIERTIDMVSAEFPITVVPATAVLEVTREGGATAKVGYIQYQTFAAYGDEAVGAAMQSFADAGVEELVLDMRYNGGGSVAVARDLASMIGGAKTKDKLFAYLRYNPKQVVKNQSIVFLGAGAAGLPGPTVETLQRLVVIASPSTASASELVVNALKPFMPVKLVGGTTYGKPFGSLVRHNCGTTFHAIHFTTLNALGEANYASGFAPDCEVPDDLEHALGDPAERRLAAALHVVKTGQCPVLAPMMRQRARSEPRGPDGVIGDVDPPAMFE